MSKTEDAMSFPQVRSFSDENVIHDDDNLDDFSDEISCLDHAPATSHGLYLNGIQDGIEDLEDYCEGGYHPIHLGDCLGARYRVIHKLGHGGFSTVWLCRDIQEAKYEAVKVHAADVSGDDLFDLKLLDLDQSTKGAEYINIPKDHFSLEGPNGTHLCLVFALLGPRVSPDIWMDMVNPAPILKKLCHQAVLALNFLHQNGICHGDFRPANILLTLANIDHFSEVELLSLLGKPEESEVCTESGEPLPSSAPWYLVPSTDLSRLGTHHFMDQICVIDFGESFLFSDPPAELGIPEEYLAPEVLIDGGETISPAVDLWALGCTLYEIRRQIPLFYMLHDKDDILAEMVKLLGKLPKRWWAEWTARADYCDEDGKSIRCDTTHTLDMALAHKVGSYMEESEDKKVLDISEEERRLMHDLLMRLFSYVPEDRPSAAEVLESEYFRV